MIKETRRNRLQNILQSFLSSFMLLIIRINGCVYCSLQTWLFILENSNILIHTKFETQDRTRRERHINTERQQLEMKTRPEWTQRTGRMKSVGAKEDHVCEGEHEDWKRMPSNRSEKNERTNSGRGDRKEMEMHGRERQKSDYSNYAM